MTVLSKIFRNYKILLSFTLFSCFLEATDNNREIYINSALAQGVKVIDLSHQQIGNEEFMKRIYPQILTQKKLEKLNISNNNISNSRILSENPVLAIHTIIQKVATLRSLDISGNEFNDGDLKFIVAANNFNRLSEFKCDHYEGDEETGKISVARNGKWTIED